MAARLGVFSDVAATALARPSVVCTILARLHLYDGIARLHPGVGDLQVDGETFQGVSDPGKMRLVQLEAIEEPRAGIASAVRITMTGCDLAFLRAVRGDYLKIEGRQADLLFGLWDQATDKLIAAVPFFPGGRMTAPGMRFASPGVRDFFFTVEGMWSARNFATAGTMTPADQRRRFPGDTALDLVGGTVTVRWPIDES